MNKEENDDWRSSGGGKPPSGTSPLTGPAIRIGGLLVIALFVSSSLQGPLVAASIQQLLMLGAIVATAVAVMRRQRPLDPRLTAWDEGAVMLLIALFAGFFVDPAAVEQLLSDLRTAG